MKNIKQLALASYTDNKLDNKKILRIVNKLSRKEIKFYLKKIKLLESKNTIMVTLVDRNTDKKIINDIRKIFKNKNVVINEDKALLAGIRILDFDNLYEYDLKSKIENISKFLTK
ncbi:MAG: hypothetical protein A2798_02290 [Candidatus Levybacteria bacterium RIFCSPHIGHO2_01_FULL_37_17]|nr:MAG: hypothetical protein A2798_02290 [Candidatus Levybacteria bacterium RIFCSPHIGHO2_01_FULL_37_17]OGH36707.1 MAG: hypothetical protein A2959_00280 [Candidatus Levybacteria bacterium RIFCSPLOWO2_01_FULL_38_23]